VIDSLNVGRSWNVGFRDPTLDHEAAGFGSRPPVSGLALATAIQYFKERGHDVLAMIPEHHINGGREGTQFAHQYKLLLPFVGQEVNPVPARSDDDRWILKEALDGGEDTHVMSNDNYDKYIYDGTITAEWRDRHVFKFSWLRGQLRVDPGSTISKFLP